MTKDNVADQVVIRLGFAWRWFLLSLAALLLGAIPIAGSLIIGAYGDAVLFTLLVGVLVVGGAVTGWRTATAPTSIEVVDGTIYFGGLFGKTHSIPVADLRETRLENYRFVQQLVFETTDFVSTTVRSRKNEGWRNLLDIVDYHESFRFVGVKTKTWKPAREIAMGATAGFKAFLNDTTTVEVETVDNIIAWLNGCTYQSDFRDEWMRPSRFEQIRRGDNEEYALWGWVKLIELGYDASLVIGRPGTTRKSFVSTASVEYTDETGTANTLLVPHRENLAPAQIVNTVNLPKPGRRFSVDKNARRFFHPGT